MPFPPNYGGIIDVYYKIKYFHSKGINIHLHCFEYGRGEQKELEKYCSSVHYYKRKTGIISNLSKIPYIVNSRVSVELKQNLLNNDFPILFEGLHTTYLISDKDFANRLKIFRESNIEHRYYYHLAIAEKNTLKKIYYLWETKKLDKYERNIKNADISFVVSLTDLDYFKNRYPNLKFVFAPSFHRADTVSVKPGLGKYVLYHGNLSVAENSDAAKFIIKYIFSDLEIPLIIAGLNPPNDLIQLGNKFDNITIISNPNDKKLQELISDAQINYLYTNQATGLKLKLLNVLYNGRHCLVNSKMVEGTSLETICQVENDINIVKKTIKHLINTELPQKSIEDRIKILQKDYSNQSSFDTMMKEIEKSL